MTRLRPQYLYKYGLLEAGYLNKHCLNKVCSRGACASVGGFRASRVAPR